MAAVPPVQALPGAAEQPVHGPRTYDDDADNDPYGGQYGSSPSFPFGKSIRLMLGETLGLLLRMQKGESLGLLSWNVIRTLAGILPRL
jgi:hypothetical protein